jgi:Leucine-rich repeat (LRR) protein
LKSNSSIGAKAVGRLTNLASLNLKQNQHLFSKPSESFQLPNLKVLNASGCDVASIPFEKGFGSLTSLNLMHARNLDSFMFDRLASANSLLATLNLSSIRSTTEIEDDLEEEEEDDDEEEDESDEGSEKSIESIAAVPFLKEIFPTLSFKSLKFLTFLDLSNNSFVNNKALLTVTANAVLLKLNLSRNKVITNSTLSSIPSLQSLNLSYNRVIDNSSFEKLTTLTELDVSSCLRVTVDGVLKLKKLTKLTYSSKNRIKPEILPHLDLIRSYRTDL